MPGRAFPVAKKTTVCQKVFTQKKDSVTIKKINSCRQNVDGTSGAAVDKNKAECGKAAGYIKMVGKKDVQSEQGIEQ